MFIQIRYKQTKLTVINALNLKLITNNLKMPITASFKCVLCNKNSKGYGNNAQPKAEGRCCDKCNYEVVLPYRIADIQLREISEIDDKVADITKRGGEHLRNAFAFTIKMELRQGINSFGLSTPKGETKNIVVPPISMAHLAPNRMKTPPPLTEEQLANLFAKEDLSGKKKGKSKKQLDAEAKTEATRIANLEIQEERRRKKDFEKEVARKEALKQKSAKK